MMKVKYLAIVLILSGLFVTANKSYACPPPPPGANLRDYPDPVFVGESVTLDGSSSWGSGGIIKYEWDWTNDGIYDHNETPGDGKATHIYPSARTYTAKLRVTEGYYWHRKDTDTCVVHVLLDEVAPEPNPMTWATVPYAIGSTSISMTATTATDVSDVEYYFECAAGGGHHSGWQDSPIYTDTDLSPDTSYTYRVKARDKSTNQNEASWSTSESAIIVNRL